LSVRKILPTILSQQAYLWLITNDAVEKHKSKRSRCSRRRDQPHSVQVELQLPRVAADVVGSANATSDAEIEDALQSAATPEISVTLAGEPTRLRFVNVHFEDLRTISTVVTRSQTLAKSAK
jgi:hypothetical protein